MFGTIVNTVAVAIGAGIGMLLGRGIPERISKAVIKAFALVTLMIGVRGALEGISPYVTILSVALGTIIGEALDLQRGIEKFAERLEQKMAGDGESRVAKGFITATLLFCMGAMAIVGSIEGGLRADHTMTLTKATIDFIAAIFLASSLGIGVMLAAGGVLVYQGGIVLLASLIAPLLSDVVITEISAVGSLLLIGLAFNMLELTELRIMNYIPAIVLPIVLSPLLGMIF